MTNEVTIHVKVRDLASKAIDTIVRTIVRNMVQATAAVTAWGAAIASAVPAAVALIKPVVVWTAQLTSAFLRASPVLAAFAVQGLFVKATLGQIFDKENAMVKALTPMGKAFTDAGKAASKASAEGIRPMVEDLIKAGLMDRVAGTMKRIGVEVNKVAFGFLTWAKTKPGAQAIGQILNGIDRTVKNLSTPITNLGMSFFEMVGRISDVAAAAGSNGLTSVMNHLARAMDKVTAASVSKGLDDFAAKITEVRDAIVAIVDIGSKIVHFWNQHAKAINRAADALGLVAIALGIIAGSPIIVAIAAISLLIRHFRQLPGVVKILKKAFAKGEEIFGPLIQAFEYLGREVLPEVIKGFRKIASSVLPVLKRIGKAIESDLIPALGEFVVAVAPVIRVMVHRLAPIVAAVMKTMARVVLANIHIAAAAFRAMAAILRVAMSAYNALRGAVTRAMNGMRNAVRSGVNAVINLIRSLISRIKGAFAGAGGWLVGAGRAIIHGLVAGIRGAAGAAASAAANVVHRAIAAARSLIPGHAGGGLVSAAAGGGNHGGMVLVGERGPELVQLPGGSHVFPNGNSTMGGRGGGQSVHFHFHGPVYGDHNALKRALVNMKRAGDLDLVLR